MRAALVALTIALAAGCAHGPRFDPRARPTCLVLSVGGPAGVSHLGALRAVREAHLPITCVVGNSMGALVGALYAHDPSGDPEASFRAVAAAYRAETQRVVHRNGVALGLLFGALAVLTTDGVAPPALAAGGGYALGAAVTPKLDRDRLVGVLDRALAGASIETLPLAFATFHHRATDSGVELVAVRSGNLAEAVGRSIANPLIFPGLAIRAGSAVDPGADRVAAVPVDDACRLFPAHNLLVVNASGADVFTGPDLRCPVREARIPPQSLSPDAALAFGAAYDRAVRAGYDATRAALR